MGLLGPCDGLNCRLWIYGILAAQGARFWIRQRLVCSGQFAHGGRCLRSRILCRWVKGVVLKRAVVRWIATNLLFSLYCHE